MPSLRAFRHPFFMCGGGWEAGGGGWVVDGGGRGAGVGLGRGFDVVIWGGDTIQM